MIEDLSDPSLVLLAAVIVWIPVTIWVVCSVFWVVQGDLDFGIGLLSVYSAFVVGYFAVRPPEPWVGPALMYGAWAFVLFFPLAQRAVARARQAAFDAERLEAAYEEAESTATRALGLIRMGRVLRDAGLPVHAAKLVEAGIGGLPPHAAREEHALLRSILHEAGPESSQPLPCLRCGVDNLPGAIHCSRCRCRFLLDHVRRRSSPLVLRVFAVAAVVFGLAVAVSGAVAALPRAVAAMAISLQLGFACWTAYRVFASSETQR